MPTTPGKRVVFGEDAAKRIADVVRRVEASPYFGAGGSLGGPRNWNPGVLPAVVTTAITPATSTNFGAGAVQIKSDDGTGTITNHPTYPSPVPVSNFSLSSGTISVGTRVLVYWANATFNLCVRDC